MIFQLNVVHNLPTKVPQKLLDEKLLLLSVQACSNAKRWRPQRLGVNLLFVLFVQGSNKRCIPKMIIAPKIDIKYCRVCFSI
jgi:hypothetical protein